MVYCASTEHPPAIYTRNVDIAI